MVDRTTASARNAERKGRTERRPATLRAVHSARRARPTAVPDADRDILGPWVMGAKHLTRQVRAATIATTSSSATPAWTPPGRSGSRGSLRPGCGSVSGRRGCSCRRGTSSRARTGRPACTARCRRRPGWCPSCPPRIWPTPGTATPSGWRSGRMTPRGSSAGSCRSGSRSASPRACCAQPPTSIWSAATRRPPPTRCSRGSPRPSKAEPSPPSPRSSPARTVAQRAVPTNRISPELPVRSPPRAGQPRAGQPRAGRARPRSRPSRCCTSPTPSSGRTTCAAIPG